MAPEYQTGIWRVSANLLTYARITKRYLEHQKSSILNSNKFAFKLPKLAFKMPKIDILNDTNRDLSFMKLIPECWAWRVGGGESKTNL